MIVNGAPKIVLVKLFSTTDSTILTLIWKGRTNMVLATKVLESLNVTVNYWY